MPSTYTFDSKTTTINFKWPAGLNGLERILLSSQGELQRLLSAFFDHPIVVEVISMQTHFASSPSFTVDLTAEKVATVSSSNPIVQTRLVYIKHLDQVVCSAASTVLITSPEAANLFLIQCYAIGQAFKMLGISPEFELLHVGADRTSFSRHYILTIPGFRCEIKEDFPSRSMFSMGICAR